MGLLLRDLLISVQREGALGLKMLNLELRKMPPHLLECQVGPKEK